MSVQAAVKAILTPLGLRGLGRSLQRKRLEHRYRHVDRWEGEVAGVPLSFSTEDGYSKRWFFPRYEHGRLHERGVTELLAEKLVGARCFVDVGTNLGWFTCLAGRLLPDGVVHGFEMDETNFALARRNVELNGLGNVRLHAAAVADAPGEVRYARSTREGHPGFQLLDDAASDAAAVSVEAVTLDAVFAVSGPAPDVVKIDVEGAELRVLTGMAALLRDRAPRIFVEVHPEKMRAFRAEPGDVIARLADTGYSVCEIEGLRDPDAAARLRPVDPETRFDDNVMLYAATDQ